MPSPKYFAHESPKVVRRWQRLKAMHDGTALPSKDWSKPGAFKEGKQVLSSRRIGKPVGPKPEWVRNEIERRLLKWDFLPIREKIAHIKELHNALENPAGRAGAFKFLAMAQHAPEMDVIKNNVHSRLAMEKMAYEDMKRVFKHWGVELQTLGIEEGDISRPHGTEILYKQIGSLANFDTICKDPIVLRSPATDKWYNEKVVPSGRRATRFEMSSKTEKTIGEKKPFGISRVYESMKEKTALVHPLQTLAFYKKVSGMEVGKDGTAIAPPLKHPDLLILYELLKDGMKSGVNKVVVMHPLWPKIKQMASERKSLPPHHAIYHRLSQLSSQITPAEDATTCAIFMARKTQA